MWRGSGLENRQVRKGRGSIPPPSATVTMAAAPRHYRPPRGALLSLRQTRGVPRRRAALLASGQLGALRRGCTTSRRAGQGKKQPPTPAKNNPRAPTQEPRQHAGATCVARPGTRKLPRMEVQPRGLGQQPQAHERTPPRLARSPQGSDPTGPRTVRAVWQQGH